MTDSTARRRLLSDMVDALIAGTEIPKPVLVGDGGELAPSHWHELWRDEAVAFDALRATPKSNPPAKARALRAWWATVEKACKGYRAAVESGGVADLPPTAMMERIGALAAFLAVGQVPIPIARVSGALPGHPVASPPEQHDKAIAVAYRQACNTEGLANGGSKIYIDDHKPMQNLSAWFGGATPETIRTWVRKYQPAQVGPEIDAAGLTLLAKRAGKNYAAASRGSLARVATI